MSSSVHQFLNQLLARGELDGIYVCDLEGNIIIELPDPAVETSDAPQIPTNAILTAASTFRLSQQLPGGTFSMISAQYRDRRIVQFVEGILLVTLLGSLSATMGGLQALAHQIRSNSVFHDAEMALKNAMDR